MLECANYGGSDLGAILEEQLDNTSMFLDDHRYDPSEIYDEEFLDDLKNIPNPKEDPESLLKDFQHVLSTMGECLGCIIVFSSKIHGIHS